ncbi:MAG TPA: PqqD family protein [Candidatus Woesebacteria bacterium]|nr:PqqD family protein [Candidatus Woesebacteria bacterium]
MKNQLKEKKYTINPQLLIQELQEQVLIFDSNKSYLLTLNGTASLIFLLIKNGGTIENIIVEIMSQYKVEYNKVSIETQTFIEELKEKKIIIQV